MRKIFYMDESAINPGLWMIRVHVDLLPFSTTIGSLNVLPARLLNLHYADYLRFCRDILFADVRGKNKLYPVPYFKRDALLDQFIKLLNARAEFVLWEDEHSDYQEHLKALEDFKKIRNLRKSEN